MCSSSSCRSSSILIYFFAFLAAVFLGAAFLGAAFFATVFFLGAVREEGREMREGGMREGIKGTLSNSMRRRGRDGHGE